MVESADEFLRLNESQDPELRWRGRTAHAPRHVWLELLNGDNETLETVALAKNVPVDILDRLAETDCEDVRKFVAMRRKLSLGAMLKLCGDKSDLVRLILVTNPKAPRSVLQRLAQDADDYVASVAQGRLE